MLVLVGLVLGLFSATVTESFFHKFFGHPSEKVLKFFFKSRRLFSACLKPYYQHLVIHHKKNYLNHFFRQFDSYQHKKDVDNWIHKTFDKKFAQLIWLERYNLTLKGFVGTLPFAGPFCIGPFFIAVFFGPEAFFASLVTAYLPVWLSKYIHPLVHQPHETYQHSAFIRWFMKTKYAEKVLLNHYLHHQSESTNFNLLLGGDYILGVHRKPTPEEEIEFKTLLNEFRVKVRQEEGLEVNDSISKDFKYVKNQASQFAVTSEMKKYVALGKPTTEERFAFQKFSFTRQNTNHKPSDSHESFGFGLFDNNIDYKKWMDFDEFSANSYQWDGDAIVCKGHTFRTGDVLLTNQNSDSDGLFSTLLTRDINFAHAAMYVTLIVGSKKVPAVVEMVEEGIRAVPLKSLLSESFNNYIEVYRYNNEVNSRFAEDLSAATLEVLNEVHAFDIYQNRAQSHFLNCSRTVELIYKKAGIELNIGDSFYHPDTFENLHVLGIESAINKPLLMPDDFYLSENFNLTGCLANGDLVDLISRNLVRTMIQRVWRSQLLEQSKFDLKYKLNSFVIKMIQIDNYLSKFFLKTTGLSKEKFPSGPVVFLSLVPKSDEAMKSGVKFIRNYLKNNWSKYEKMSWQELIESPSLQKMLQVSMQEFETMFADASPLPINGRAISKKKILLPSLKWG